MGFFLFFLFFYFFLKSTTPLTIVSGILDQGVPADQTDCFSACLLFWLRKDAFLGLFFAVLFCRGCTIWRLACLLILFCFLLCYWLLSRPVMPHGNLCYQSWGMGFRFCFSLSRFFGKGIYFFCFAAVGLAAGC